jgi:hypothetical protein
MGGSSKPADPTVTPFQEPAPPTNPIPNFFSGRTAAGGGTYQPDMGASANAFGQQPMAQPEPQPMQPMQPMMGSMGQQPSYQAPAGPPMQDMQRGGSAFSIPTRRNSDAQVPGQFGNMFGGDMRANMRNFIEPGGFDRFREMFNGGMRDVPRMPQRPQNYGIRPGTDGRG